MMRLDEDIAQHFAENPMLLAKGLLKKLYDQNAVFALIKNNGRVSGKCSMVLQRDYSLDC